MESNRGWKGRWKKGESGNPAGRPIGVQNKATKAIREHYQHLIEGNLDNITMWLEKVAKEDPAKALDFMLRLSPFVIHKLNAVDVTTAGDPINIIMPKFTDDNKDE